MQPRLILTLTTAATLVACGGSDTTTGTRVTLRTALESDLGPDHAFVTNNGWAVTVTEAAVATGALYYFDGEPAFTFQRVPLYRELFEALTLQPHAALAHPGHYVPGNAKGQQLAPFTVDLMAGTTMLPDGDGVSGAFRSGTFSFAAPTAGPAEAALAGSVARVKGRATKDGRTIHFLATAELADITKTAKDGQVTGCVFTAAEVAGDGTVTVTVSPRVWFNLVDFAELSDGTADSPSLFPDDSTARIAFALGLTQLSAYHMAFNPL